MDNYISFNIEYPDLIINNQDEIIKGIENIFIEENYAKELSIALVFLSDEELLVFNKEFLNHDYYTDIITFPIEESDDYLEADLLFSIDRIIDNAKELNVSFIEELNRVIIHGVLHLVGYNDHTEEDKNTMRIRENFYLSKLSFI